MWNDGPSINATQWVLFGLSCFALTVRLGACRRPGYGFWWDDFVMFGSLALFLATCITATLALGWGCGKDSSDVDPLILPRATLMGIIATDLGMLADATPKIGVALLIVRLFHPPWWMRWFAVISTILGVVFNALLLIFSFVQCSPVKYQWNRDTMNGTCWNISVYTDFAYFTGSWSAFLDLTFSLYPLVVISQLKMQWRKKLGVMATMSFGFATFAVTTYKVATQYPLFEHAAFDATKVLANIMLWNAMGACFTIIAGSIPTWGWMFHTTPWRRFVACISRMPISPSSSRKTSGNSEKWPLTAPSQLTPTPTPVGPLRDPPPLTFPQRAQYSGRSSERTVSTRTGHMSDGSSRRGHYSAGSSRRGHGSATSSRGGHFSTGSRTSAGQGQRQTGHTSNQSSNPPLPVDSILALEHSTWRS